MISIIFNISTASSPGHSDENEKSGSSRNFWFQPRGLEDLPEINSLFSNDTSIGCGYYPLKTIESYILQLETDLTKGEFADKYDWAGTDVKIMGSDIMGEIEVTLCVPQISKYVPSLEQYIMNISIIKTYLSQHSKKYLGKEISFNLNTRDDYVKQELYLTATGSSIESGDEGLVGRGNRVNQLISINSPMSMEGASGKNPVYHIGKLYYIAAHQISKKIYDEFDGLQNEVFLVSNSGRALTSPWKTVIKVPEGTKVKMADLEAFASEQLNNIPLITKQLVANPSTLIIS
jgi:S-adenosylmethionine synthetase